MKIKLILLNLCLVGLLTVITLVGSQTPTIKSNEVFTHKDGNLKFRGWGQAEETHRWSVGNRSVILFKFKEDKKSLVGEIEFQGGSLGQQHIIAKLNGTKIHDGMMEAKLKMKFAPKLLKGKNQENELAFELPDARVPGNGDMRRLAIYFSSLVIR